MTDRTIHNLVQGTDEWANFRLHHFGASEAAAMLGLSSKVKRTELLHMKHTGTAKEFSDWVQKNILDYGHEVEALARPIIEDLIGEDLYPVTCSDGDLSASCDGLTMSEELAFEHKQHNAALAESVRNKILPEEHQPQCQQVMMVTGAKKVIFTVSDGTRENMEYMEVFPDPAWHERIRAGWAQFKKDLAAYVPEAVEVKPIGRTPETLPALRVEVTGKVTASNLIEFRDHALAVFAGINRELVTDQHFADAEKTVKWCGEVESRLEAAKEHALSQTQSIDELFKTIDAISSEARAVRLELDKLVSRRKVEIKEGIILKAKAMYEQHIAGLKEETGGPWIVLTAPDFAGAAKGKRTVASIQDAANTVLANAKIEADASAKRIRTSLACIKDESVGYEFLFADKLALVGKPIEDLQLVIRTRISDHKAAEEKRIEAERERIRKEEQEKAEAKIPAPVTTSPAPISAKQEQFAPWTAPARITSDAAPTLRLGQINERLAPISLTADGLASLGFVHAATGKAAKLYHEEIFPQICAALIRHIEAVSGEQAMLRQQAA
ncbi:Phage tail length tape-measure protein [Caballeronia glathei]|uniref:YqaJ viral recombinase family protein n=1 Tax=Caballeronia glathei TaxID=60547 RepID=UPI0004FF6F04|nr:YqaJ viral recombinase family protein [Caballeronia glathei]CDY79425.1 Phage tail length tape-measure protein [Caballeronia glathei]